MAIEFDKVLAAQIEWQAAPAHGETAVRDLAEASLDRCAEAVSILFHNIEKIGYGWAKVEPISLKELARNIQKIEKCTGSVVPPILALFWERIGGVSLVDLEDYQHVNFWKDHGLTGLVEFCDGLYIDPCSKEWADFTCDDFRDWKKFREDEESDFLLSLSPDGFHKDGISGGAPYSILPGPSWQPALQYFEWTGIQRPVTALSDPPDFLSYLRTTILECAGFPAYLGLAPFEPLRERLLVGVPVF